MSKVKREIKRLFTRKPKRQLATHAPAEAIETADAPFDTVPFAELALQKLCRDYQFNSVVDIGSGAGLHSAVFREQGKHVTAVDFGSSVYFNRREDDYTYVRGDFMTLDFENKFDCAWASHVLEHQPNPGAFINRMMEIVADDGLIAITVPPLKHEIVGGHLSLWNAGLLLYQLVFAGLDCRDAAVRSWGYNVSVIARNRRRPHVELDYDSGDVERLKEFFPLEAKEGFDGRIEKVNW